MEEEGIMKKLEEIGKPYGMTAKDLRADFDARKQESGATDLVVLGMVKKCVEDALGLPEEKPAEKPPAATAPTTVAVAKPEVKELLEGSAAERSRLAKIEVKKAAEIFGDKAKQPDRDILEIQAENDANLTCSYPKGLEYTGEQWIIKNRVQATRSIRNKLSKFGAFLRKYGQYPTIGIEVETDLDDDGFARIVV